MPRPKRPGWSKITITVSEKVAKEIRVRSADLGIEMGTFVDQTIRDHAPIAKLMDKTLAEDVLEGVRQHPNPTELMDVIVAEFKRGGFVLDKQPTLASMTPMIEAWVKAGRIPQPWKWVMYFALAQWEWLPTSVKSGMLKGFEWFRR